MDSMKINTIFPTLYATKINPDHDKVKDDLVDFCYRMEKHSPQSSSWEGQKAGDCGDTGPDYYGSLLSETAGNIFQYEEMDSVKKCVEEGLDYLNEKMHFPSYEHHAYKFENAWININRKNSMHRAHSHGPSTWSGIYYIKVPKNAAPIIFTNALGEYRNHWPVCMAPQKRNEYTAGQVIHYPKEGELVMFPGWLIHNVPVHQVEEDRINVSFNVT